MDENAAGRNTRKTFENGTTIDDFTIIGLLGQGGFGDVYKVRDNSGAIYAMKTENMYAAKQGLSKEIRCLKTVQGPGVPKIIAHGSDDETNYLVMEMFGPSLGQIRKMHSNSIAMRIALFLSIEMLKSIQLFHSRGYIHRDIKPSNFLLKKDRKNPLVLIDFGLCKPYINLDTHELLPPSDKSRFIGTKKYASVNSHRNQDLARRDDLISWFYSVIEMFRGKLPWHRVRDKDEMLAFKERMSGEDLCRPMPRQFLSVWTYINSLSFYAEPEYEYMSGMLFQVCSQFQYHIESFDWVKYYDDHMPKPENEENGDANHSSSDNSKKEQHQTNNNSSQVIAEPGCAACIVY